MENIVKAICRKEGITCQTIQVLPGGQVNAVFLVDGKYILRIGAREDAGQRLERETLILQNLAGQLPVAKVLAFGQEQGFFYQVQQYMPGQQLYTIWKTLTAAVQDTIAAELAASLKILHSANFSDFGDGWQDSKRYATWSDYLTDMFQNTIEEIRDLNIRMVPGFIEMAVNYFEEHKKVLQEGVPTLVHSDMTLVNILAENGKVSAILDFEFARQAPADYELLAIEAFCLYPKDWAEEENEVFCTADFANIIPLIRKHYPGLFEIRNLRERLNVYHVYTTLSSYLEWRKANLSTIPPERMAAKEFYMGRITNFLWDNGARMFYA
ncbi:MAG: aminoglycoside phosphotransferase family protein [Anaerolineales bacterium]|nr:MAG: aminoglycoside phosphotransferase family protein [Anaerolineales bacterium]